MVNHSVHISFYLKIRSTIFYFIGTDSRCLLQRGFRNIGVKSKVSEPDCWGWNPGSYFLYWQCSLANYALCTSFLILPKIKLMIVLSFYVFCENNICYAWTTVANMVNTQNLLIIITIITT